MIAALITNFIIAILLFIYFHLDENYQLDWIPKKYEGTAITLLVGSAYYSAVGAVVWLIT